MRFANLFCGASFIGVSLAKALPVPSPFEVEDVQQAQPIAQVNLTHYPSSLLSTVKLTSTTARESSKQAKMPNHSPCSA